MKSSVRFLSGVFLSRLGDSFSFLAFTLLLTGQGTSNSKVSLFMIARYLPSVLIGLFLKQHLDRWPRKKVLIASYLISGILTGLAAIFTADLNVLLSLSLLLGTAYGIYVPLQRTLIADIFPRNQIKQANAWVQMADVSAKTIGFLLAGLMFHHLGPQTSFLSDSLSFVLIAVLFATLTSDKKNAQTGGSQNAKIASNTTPDQLSRASGIFALSWLGTGTLFALEASYAKTYMSASEAMIGWLFACATLGSLFTPYIIRKLPGEVKIRHLSIAALAEIVFVAAYAVCNHMIPASLCIVAYGIFLTLRHILMASWIHSKIPSTQLGSAFAYQQAQANLAMLLGMGLSGPLSEIFGVRVLILATTAMSFIGVIFLTIKPRFSFDYFKIKSIFSEPAAKSACPLKRASGLRLDRREALK